VYVVPEARRLGVFRALYEHIEAEGRRDPDVKGLRLYVEEKNVKALRVYEALGMHASGYRVYEKEWA
jgi:ribosomal protein S18 acetylase RimI-like enzyme